MKSGEGEGEGKRLESVMAAKFGGRCLLPVVCG